MRIDAQPQVLFKLSGMLIIVLEISDSLFVHFSSEDLSITLFTLIPAILFIELTARAILSFGLFKARVTLHLLIKYSEDDSA